MMLRNTAFAASEAITTLPSARSHLPLTGEIYSFRNQGMDIQKKLFFGHDLGNGIFANTANANDVIESFTYINYDLD
ncbi:hypothetical protein [Phascolarctobacterium succinatutens]|uniref:hypothetical protein n=1 Tax=Phascolarctobacterium succinatutens TaxID=626940 RepID=UPI003AB26E7A